jgi:hypothetical protein
MRNTACSPDGVQCPPESGADRAARLLVREHCQVAREIRKSGPRLLDRRRPISFNGKQAADTNWRRSHRLCAGSGSDAYEATMPALNDAADVSLNATFCRNQA